MANSKSSPVIRLDLENLLDKLREQKEEIETFSPVKEVGKTRSKIATTFVRWYFFLLVGVLIFLVVYNAVVLILNKPELILEPKDLLLIVTTAIGSPLGFVIGYYFKDGDSSQ